MSLIHTLASPSFEETDIAAVVRVLRSGALVQGAEVRLFESRVEAFIGARHAIAVANGTIAIQLALSALDIGPGDEVIVPAFSFIATANAVVLCGARPVFVDVDARTFNIDPTRVCHAVSPRTKAILPVHEFGLCCDIDALVAIARRHNLAVVEDAACALGSRSVGRHAGTMGDIGTFSLHPRKIITCGEGGLITTASDTLAERLRALRNHGAAPAAQSPEFLLSGYNARLTDFQAALASGQMTRLENNLSHRRNLAELYGNLIRHPSLELPIVPKGNQPNWQTYHLLLAEHLDQVEVIAYLRAQGIGTNVGAQCIPAQHCYLASHEENCAARFPNAWRAWKKGLAIPLHERISTADAKFIAATLNKLPTS